MRLVENSISLGSFHAIILLSFSKREFSDNLTHAEAITLIKSGGKELTLSLQRGNGQVPEIPKAPDTPGSGSGSHGSRKDWNFLTYYDS